ncbi:MAG: F0F1 ATP synthase subunit gamma [Acetobacteraceae bacterium]|nr:F0F1 ATP synthase subunit gamma [Acetobacteraceae bacterium]
MPSLKSLRSRINSVKSTRKITQAMKMVAASKLRRAQSQAEAARPYAERMERMLETLGRSSAENPNAPVLLRGSGQDQTHLLVVVTADRGLCGAFNASVARFARGRIRELAAAGRTVKILPIGRKGRDNLRRDHAPMLIPGIDFAGKRRIGFADAEAIGLKLATMAENGEFDSCTLIYNHFKSVIAQIPTAQQLIPLPLPEEATSEAGAVVEFEPGEEEILATLLPRNLAVQIYRALLDSAAGEQGARMTAMDNATRNAGDMINRLTLNYNRQRQANITKELIEIISGAEAV